MAQQELVIVDKRGSPEPEALQPSATPMALLAIAMSQNADIDKLKALMELQERWEANEARKAFTKALAEFKANPPQVTKNKHAGYDGKTSGRVDYDYASLDNVTESIQQGLSKYGLAHRWNVEQGQGVIRVTCILTHEAGHSEKVTMEGLADATGSKNAIQSIGSTVTYLERYTLLAATGLAAGGQDDDGRGGKTNGVAADVLRERIEWIENCRTLPELQKIFAEAYKLANAAQDKIAMATLIKAKDTQKKVLQ